MANKILLIFTRALHIFNNNDRKVMNIYYGSPYTRHGDKIVKNTEAGSSGGC